MILAIDDVVHALIAKSNYVAGYLVVSAPEPGMQISDVILCDVVHALVTKPDIIATIAKLIVHAGMAKTNLRAFRAVGIALRVITAPNASA